MVLECSEALKAVVLEAELKRIQCRQGLTALRHLWPRSRDLRVWTLLILCQYLWCRPAPINKKPDLYAKRSKGFVADSIVTMVTLTAGAAFFILPVVAAASVVIPAIGAAAWGSGLLATGATISGFFGLASSLGASAAVVVGGIVQTVRTVRGANVDILEEEAIAREKQRSNRIEVRIICLFIYSLCFTAFFNSFSGIFLKRSCLEFIVKLKYFTLNTGFTFQRLFKS
jgi:hypothetical protein